MARTILIVDDSAAERALLAGLLGAEYRVLAAAGGKEMIDLLRERAKSISAVLLDLVMPEMDGFEVLRRLRGNAVYRQIPVIAVTGLTDVDSQVKALSLGANGYVFKPFNRKLLTYTLENAINLREKSALVNTFRKDPLTGILNRATFFETAESMIHRREPGYYILSCLDIENFKIINDQYGFETGDAVLRHVAAKLEQGMLAMGGVCCRYSADKFGLLYPAAYKDSEQLRALHENVVTGQHLRQTIKIRIGRYLADDLSVPVSSMYDRATLAEESIRGRYDTCLAEYTVSMRARLLSEQRIVNDMGPALAAGEFEPWFQPQYNHATGALIGAEALVRWNKNGKYLPPAEFVPVFERNGFIYEMDQYIWEQVCRLLRRWLDEKRDPLPVSVNISRYDLFRPDFLDVLTGLVKKYDVPYPLLRLEVTESAFAETSGQIIARVGKLIDLGFTVEIDDFGSGYSSLNTLKDVPAAILKLDMKFFEKTKNQQRGGNIVESVVRMSKWLGMAVIAEGVEDKEQADYLKSIGCYYIQGYYYAKPMPASAYEALLQKGEREPELTRLKKLKTLDNSEFWNPRSMDTLIFNSYVGGACIFEFHHEKSELLRINEQYTSELGALGAPDTPLKDASLVRFLDEAGRNTLIAAIHSAIDRQEETSREVRLSDGTHTEYVRITLRLIARASGRYLFYAVVVNMTEQREAERRQAESARQLAIIMANVNGGVSAIRIFDDGHSTLIFHNDKYFELYGYTRQQAEAEKLDVMTTIVPEDLPAVLEKVKKLQTDGVPAIIDYRIRKRGGHLAYLRANASRMEMEGYGDVLTAVVTDVTAEKASAAQLRFLNDTAHDILAQPDSNLAVNKTLENLLAYFAGDRAYVIELDRERKVSSNSYEKCAPGISSEMARLQSIPFSVSDYWIEALEKDQYIIIEDVNALDDSRAALRELLREQSIRALIVAPLWRDRVLVGFVGVDNPTRAAHELGNLKALGDYIAVLLTRRDLDAKIDNDQKMMLALMDDTPGAFVRMKLTPAGSFVPVYSNEGFSKLVGMSHEALHEIYGQDVLGGVHPEDRDIVRRAGESMMTRGEAESARFRVRRGDGSYIWLTLYGRMTRDVSGDTYLNVYYSDATRQVNEEHKQRELLDNLPCGAALYEFDGTNLSVIHINKSYWQLVNRPPMDYAQASVLDMLHPDDRPLVSQEIAAAIRQGRNVGLSLRILCGDGVYKPFRIDAKLTREKRGKHLFYAAYTPISEHTMSLQEMIPIALSTMMSASGDLSYVKDKDLHYICCSQSVAALLRLSSPRDIIGKTDFELFDKKLAQDFVDRDAGIVERGESLVDFTERLPGADGVTHLVSTSKYPLMDASGAVIGLYGVSRDITAQREKESQLELLTSSIPGGLAAYAINDDGIQMLYFNEGFYNCFGYSREEYAARVEADPLAFVFEEDQGAIRAMIQGFRAHKVDGHVNGCVYRCHTKDGGYRWMSMKTVLSQLGENEFIVNVVQLDITEQQEEKERLRVSEELNRLAIAQSGKIITRFDVKSRTLTLPDSFSPIFQLPHVLTHMPGEQIALGRVSPDTADVYTELFESIVRGQAAGSATYKQNSTKGWRWLDARYTTVFSSAGKPVSAVISFTDITEQLEKEVVYNKWQQSLDERPENSYTLFRCNLSKNASFDSREGTLLDVRFADADKSFNERTAEYVRQCVCPEDRARYLAFLNSDTLLAEYYRGHRSDALEYRECAADGGTRWRRLSVDLVEYPSSRDVEVYLMFEDIDAQKKADLLTLARSETDPLTGIYNRATFIERMEAALAATAATGESHALMMLDVDNFKHVNDTLGHGAGDELLRELSAHIRAMLRHDDLLGRMGGDEFFVFLRDIPNAAAAAAKAAQICALNLTPPRSQQPITVSVGIALIPRDGGSFDELYKKVDAALYRKKEQGKAGYLFVTE